MLFTRIINQDRVYVHAEHVMAFAAYIAPDSARAAAGVQYLGTALQHGIGGSRFTVNIFTLCLKHLPATSVVMRVRWICIRDFFPSSHNNQYRRSTWGYDS